MSILLQNRLGIKIERLCVMDKHEERYMWIAISVVIVGTFMAALDSSIVNVAIPKMMSIFRVSTDQFEWILTGYLLTMSIVIPLKGYLGDRFGLKKFIYFALTVFTIGSTLCGLATSTKTMVAARVEQAIGPTLSGYFIQYMN